MEWIEKLPWWVKWAFSGGLGLLSAFAATVIPGILQYVLFVIGAALILVALVGTIWHFWGGKGRAGLSRTARPALEISFDPANPHKRFWSLEQMHDETGKPVAGHLWWEYRALIRNNSNKTVRNVKVTVEAKAPIPLRQELSIFDMNKKQQIDLNPGEETLAVLRRWYNPPIMAGMAGRGAYGPIEMTVSADDVAAVRKLFSFEPEKTPMISENL